MKTTDEPVVVEQTFEASLETVWKAVTEIGQMRRWYFENIPSFKPEVGFETHFDVRSGDRDFLHMWTVTEVVPRKKIGYDWRYEGYPGDSVVVFELAAQNDRTTLRLTHQVREDFPEDIPEFSRANCHEGWMYFICQRLKDFLERDSE